jgi:hypothetical protein
MEFPDTTGSSAPCLFQSTGMCRIDHRHWSSVPYDRFFLRAGPLLAAGAVRIPQDQLGHEENLRRTPRSNRPARECSLPVSVLSSAYMRSQSALVYQLSRCPKMEQLAENRRAKDIELELAMVTYLKDGR